MPNIAPVIDSLTEALQAIREVLRKQEDRIEALAERLSDAVTTFHETERRQRWHETRDAALTGLLAHPYSPDEYFSESDPSPLEVAAEWANKAHGPLEKDE